MTYRDEVDEHLSAVEELRGDQIELIELGVRLGLEAAAQQAGELFAGFHSPWEYGENVEEAIRKIVPACVMGKP